MKYLKRYNEGREPKISRVKPVDPGDDPKLICFNKRFQETLNVLGLTYIYQPVYRLEQPGYPIKDGIQTGKFERVGENHSYTICTNLNAQPYSILGLLISPLDEKAEVLPIIGNKKSEEIEFTININNKYLNKVTQMPLTDTCFKQAIEMIINFFNKVRKLDMYEPIDLLGFDVEEKKILDFKKIKNCLLTYLKDNMKSETIVIPQLIIDILNEKITDMNFKIISNIRKNNPILYSKLEHKTNKLNTASDMGEMGF